ncbi:MAG: nucleoside triphosphate pyrophosphohydrolase [Spirochaetia bacterium]|nr:nucleoside triphosphate pyrophosphohydrolase [Spirochaetia bacterium]
MTSNFEHIEMLEQLSKDEQEQLSTAWIDFYRIIKTLRSPDGCPWDRKQTAKSLAPNLIEESYELVEAIDNNDVENIREEIGDIFLVAGMIAHINAESNKFSLAEVISEVSVKLVRRHPHVFGDVKKENPDEVIELWNHIKKNVEKNGSEFESINDSIPRSLPPLERAFKIQKKVAKVGFDWDNLQSVKDKVTEELAELDACIQDLNNPAQQAAVEEEIGDVLFSIINLARHLKVEPAVALHKTNQKFADRFRYIEEQMYLEQRSMDKSEFDRMDELWEEAKIRLKNL